MTLRLPAPALAMTLVTTTIGAGLALAACDGAALTTTPAGDRAALLAGSLEEPAGDRSPWPTIPDAERPLPTPSLLPPPARLVAIGDLHGDLEAARRALALAGAIDVDDRWIGGALVVVQLGDEIDRGDDDRAVLDLFERLAEEAAREGGAVIPLLGNHEIMNVDRDLRYATPGAFASFADGAGADLDDEHLVDVPRAARGLVAAYQPGGPYAHLLSRRLVAVQVGETLLVHGGLRPEHAADGGLEALNLATRAWLRGEGPRPAQLGSESERLPTWMRDYSLDTDARACALLDETLEAFGAARIVVAHTIQDDGINAACEGRAWRIDVGMSGFYGGPVEALELRGPRARVLREAR